MKITYKLSRYLVICISRLAVIWIVRSAGLCSATGSCTVLLGLAHWFLHLGPGVPNCIAFDEARECWKSLYVKMHVKF